MRWADDHGEPVATLPEPGRFVAPVLALVVGISVGFLVASPPLESSPHCHDSGRVTTAVID